ncbi:MAG: glutamine amidotransferase subunit PdxT [Epulopiscium sp. Nuni2H_MBin003]|nr:MAG: glutamine amidotransferase subunit PdxT [Epulopiscium sp. Nuni2H_MBin003]
MKIGVLALQGAFIEHIKILENLNICAIEIRQKKDFTKELSGLIIPGGESTVIGKLLVELDLMDDIRTEISNGLPVLGTCAGMILLAKDIENDTKSHIGTMDISVIRNAFGRQYDSFNATADFNGTPIEMPFIRAPYVKSIGKNVDVLSVISNKIVAVKENNQLATAFHPELTDDNTVHKYFINMISN